MEYHGRVVVVDGDVVATQCCYVGTDRQSQETKRLLTLLSLCLEGEKDGNKNKNDFFHLFF